MCWRSSAREPLIISPLLVVSAASPQFFRSLLQLLLSLERHGYTRCIIYDLGLSDAQRCRLIREFGWAQLRSLPPGPEHLRDWSNYAWKPTALAEVMEESKIPVLWLDSACVVVDRLDPMLEHLHRQGVWVPWAGRGALAERTHPQTLRDLEVEECIRMERFRAGGVCAFDPIHPGALELVKSWRELAWDPQVLAPPGSNRDSHRYDQALLTILLGRSDLDPSQDEIDISSSKPVKFLRTRNKVADFLPLKLDGIVRFYFALRRYLDVLIWKWRDQKQTARMPPA
ncbi:hypothetical protein JST97_22040 [bacterium]|nr:hypothetical protein [bacterium]